MLKTNKDKLVRLAVTGEISPATDWAAGKTGMDGRPIFLPGTGGITYNVRVGDPACGWAADHVEPGVSARNPDESANGMFNMLSCVGNEVIVTSGDAKGARGVVTGFHGGIEHVLMYFSAGVLEELNVGDRLLVRSFGQGLTLTDYPDVFVRNIDPSLLERWGIAERGGKLYVPVAKRVPARLMGSGLGASSTCRGDYDVTLFDRETVETYGLDALRLGDLVLLEDSDNTYGRCCLSGAVSVGIVVHSDCALAGHGPGITTLLTSKKPCIEGVTDAGANLADLLGLG